jgi:hypothetical protein
LRLPDADGFIVAAQKALKGNGEPGQEVDVVYLHNSEGAPVAAIVSIEAWRDPWAAKNREPMERHDHIEPEMGEEVPWLDGQHK